MAHLSTVFHKASGTLAMSEMQHEPQPLTNAKQRRLSRPNTIEEIRVKRRKRKQKKRKEDKQMSKKAKRMLKARKLELQKEKINKELEEKALYGKEQRNRALYFWKKWREERRLDNNECIQIRQIDPNNVKSLSKEHILGKGRFGVCKKACYRERIVAVKSFKESVTPQMVEREANMINSFDHPGLPFVFGISNKQKPYSMIIEFYGIDGKTVTVAEGAKTNLLKDQKTWAESLWHCSNAIAYIHQKLYIHCDIKGDNIVFHIVDGNYFPILIDFGKMKKVSDAKKYTLSTNEQEKYRLYHKHIAPEVVRGTHPQSTASDVYAFGLVISLVCHYTKYEDLRLLAVQCIHGTPHKRPGIQNIISKLSSFFNN